MSQKGTIGKRTGYNTNFCANTLAVVNRGKWQNVFCFFGNVLNYFVILKMLFGRQQQHQWQPPTILMESAYFICINSVKPGGFSIFVDCAQAPTQMRVYMKRVDTYGNQYDGHI